MELGLTPIGVLIKSRRISYLHYLISRDESKMINQLFKAQWHNPTRGDWTESVKSDLEDFDIPIDLEMIKSKSKEVFKKIVKKKAAEYCFRMLLRKKEGHSKMEKLDYMELGIKPYFSLEGLKITEIRELFKFRVRMSNFSETLGVREEVLTAPCATNIWTIKLQCTNVQCLERKWTWMLT